LTKIYPQKDKDGAVLGVFDCACGKKDVVKRLNNVQRGAFKSCGECGTNYIREVSHRIIDKVEYGRIMDIWRQMMLRCYCSGKHVTDKPELAFLNKDVQHPRYKDYGARGIGVAEIWHDRNEFYKWYLKTIPYGSSIDRLDNNRGYSPENCSAATSKQQNNNQRVRKDSPVGYTGISHTGYSWRWAIRVDGKPYTREGYISLEQALIDRNLFIANMGAPIRLQPIVDRKVRTFMLPDGKFTIMYERDYGFITGRITFDTRDHPVLLKVVHAMNGVTDQSLVKDE
jgi:transcription elongation factor Elf1